MPRLRATPYGKMTFTVTQQKSQPVLLEIDKAKEMVETLFEILPAKVEDFVCEKCGYKSPEPLWRCPGCEEWNSFNI